MDNKDNVGVISSFRGQYNWASNFYSRDVEFEGLIYPSRENAFQAAKVKLGTQEETNRARLRFTIMTARTSKTEGRKVKLRADWDEVKDEVMYVIIKEQMLRYGDLAKKLVGTYPKILVEGNYWHDNYWGDCSCARCGNKEGKNMLGNTLMRVRGELIELMKVRV